MFVLQGNPQAASTFPLCQPNEYDERTPVGIYRSQEHSVHPLFISFPSLGLLYKEKNTGRKRRKVNLVYIAVRKSIENTTFVTLANKIKMFSNVQSVQNKSHRNYASTFSLW